MVLYWRGYGTLRLSPIHIVLRSAEKNELENATFYYVNVLKIGSQVRIPNFPTWFWAFFALLYVLKRILGAIYT